MGGESAVHPLFSFGGGGAWVEISGESASSPFFWGGGEQRRLISFFSFFLWRGDARGVEQQFVVGGGSGRLGCSGRVPGVIGDKACPVQQGSLKDTFCPFETWLFPNKIGGHHH